VLHHNESAAAGELALSRGQLDLAHDCLEKAKDMSGLLLLAAAKVRTWNYLECA
jgi:hypothetical protein